MLKFIKIKKRKNKLVIASSRHKRFIKSTSFPIIIHLYVFLFFKSIFLIIKSFYLLFFFFAYKVNISNQKKKNYAWIQKLYGAFFCSFSNIFLILYIFFLLQFRELVSNRSTKKVTNKFFNLFISRLC